MAGWTRLFCIAVLPLQTTRPFRNSTLDFDQVQFIPGPSEDEKILVDIVLTPTEASESEIRARSPVDMTVLGRIPTKTQAVWAFSTRDAFSEQERAVANDSFSKFLIHINDAAAEPPDSAFLHMLQNSTMGPGFPPCLIDMPLGEENLRPVR
jgi:hypothetical protein